MSSYSKRSTAPGEAADNSHGTNYNLRIEFINNRSISPEQREAFAYLVRDRMRECFIFASMIAGANHVNASMTHVSSGQGSGDIDFMNELTPTAE